VTVAWQSTWDRDDPRLVYTVLRDESPVHTESVQSTFWSRPVLRWTDTHPSPGTTHSYRVRVVDGDGNALASAAAPAVTVAEQDGPSYSAQVIRDGAAHYWPLAGDAPATDVAAGAPLSLGTGVTAADSSAVASGGGAATFDGTPAGTGGTTRPERGPAGFSLEAWFASTSPTGGKIIGFGDGAGGAPSASHDRQLYLLADGRVMFGVHNGALRTLASTTTYGDGRWHHVVGTYARGAMALYLDGMPAASATIADTTIPYTGYWHVGGDTLSSRWTVVFTNCPGCAGQTDWPWPTSPTLAGSLDEVATYGTALTAAQVADHFLRGTDAALVGPAVLPPVVADGSFVWVRDNGEVYRIAGGAPVYVTSWAAVGGFQTPRPISRGELDAMLLLAELGLSEIFALQAEYTAIAPAPRPLGR
jgi:hypothetical protein